MYSQPPGKGGSPPHLEPLQGVFKHEDFASESEEDLKSFFEPEGVGNIHMICRKVDGNFVPSSTVILTFNKPSLPDRICC